LGKPITARHGDDQRDPSGRAERGQISLRKQQILAWSRNSALVPSNSVNERREQHQRHQENIKISITTAGKQHSSVRSRGHQARASRTSVGVATATVIAISYVSAERIKLSATGQRNTTGAPTQWRHAGGGFLRSNGDRDRGRLTARIYTARTWVRQLAPRFALWLWHVCAAVDRSDRASATDDRNPGRRDAIAGRCTGGVALAVADSLILSPRHKKWR